MNGSQVVNANIFSHYLFCDTITVIGDLHRHIDWQAWYCNLVSVSVHCLLVLSFVVVVVVVVVEFNCKYPNAREAF